MAAVPDWAAIKAEYVNTKITQKELAEKHEISVRALRERSAKEKWSEKRRAYARKKADAVCDKLHRDDVKQTVRDIESVCKLARKMIDKVNRAINQVDKVVYVSRDDKEIEQSVKPSDKDPEVEITTTKLRRKMKLSKAEGKASAKELAELSKTLLNLKTILTVDSETGDNKGGGLIEIPMMSEPEREDFEKPEAEDE